MIFLDNKCCYPCTTLEIDISNNNQSKYNLEVIFQDNSLLIRSHCCWISVDLKVKAYKKLKGYLSCSLHLSCFLLLHPHWFRRHKPKHVLAKTLPGLNWASVLEVLLSVLELRQGVGFVYSVHAMFVAVNPDIRVRWLIQIAQAVGVSGRLLVDVLLDVELVHNQFLGNAIT